MATVKTFINSASKRKSKRVNVLIKIGKLQIVVGFIDVFLGVLRLIFDPFIFGDIIQIILGLYMVLTGVFVSREKKTLSECKVTTHLVLAVIGTLGFSFLTTMLIISLVQVYSNPNYYFLKKGWYTVLFWLDSVVLFSEFILYLISTIVTSQILCCSKPTIYSYYQVERNLSPEETNVNTKKI